MINAQMLSPATAGIDLRGDYERELERSIEARRVIARTQLEVVENAVAGVERRVFEVQS